MSTSKKKKFIWDDKMTEMYIRICVQEVMQGNKPNTHLNKKGWINLQEKFKSLAKRDLDSKQLKNKWDNLKKDWQLWKKLIGKENDLGWNPIKNTIEASDDWWEAKLKEIPTAIKFREKGLLLADEMSILFGYILPSDKEALTPAPRTLPGMEITVTDLEGSGDTGDIPKLVPPIATMPLDVSEFKGKGKRVINGNSSHIKKKQNSAQSVQIPLDKLSWVVDTVHKRIESEIESCIEVLKSLNLDDQDFFYDCLHLLTEKKDARRMLLGLRESDMQVGYLKRMIYGKK